MKKQLINHDPSSRDILEHIHDDFKLWQYTRQCNEQDMRSWDLKHYSMHTNQCNSKTTSVPLCK